MPLLEDKAGVISRSYRCLMALRGLSCAFQEHPVVWKPGFYSLPGPFCRTPLQLIWSGVVLTQAVNLNGRESGLILIWMLISCFSHITALPSHTHTPAHPRTIWREIKKPGIKVKGDKVFCLPMILGHHGANCVRLSVCDHLDVCGKGGQSRLCAQAWSCEGHIVLTRS